MFTAILCLVCGLVAGAAGGTIFGAKWKQEAHDEEIKVRDELIAARDKVIAAFNEHLDKPVAAAPAAADPAPAADPLPPHPELHA